MQTAQEGGLETESAQEGPGIMGSGVISPGTVLELLILLEIGLCEAGSD